MGGGGTGAGNAEYRPGDAELLGQGRRRWIPGSGKLAADLLIRLAALDQLPTHYDILEVSADLSERQQRYLRERIPGVPVIALTATATPVRR